MKRTVLLCLFLGVAIWGSGQDYMAFKIPNSPDPLQNCAGGSNLIAFQLTDIGLNGSNTIYAVTASSVDVTLTNVGIPLNGSIVNGNTIVVPFNYSLAPTASGIYQITVSMSCDGCLDPDVQESFNISVVGVPELTINAFPDVQLCNGEAGTLTVSLANATGTESFLWSTGDTGVSTDVTIADTYSVTVTNACGSASTSIDITTGADPIINSQTCVNTGNMLTTVINATDPTGEGLTFEWLENGVPVSNGGDFTITPISATESQLEVNNINGSAHNLSIFTCEVGNSCGSTTSFGCVAVPVEFMYFRGGNSEQGVLLEWATATETDNEGFVVERSFDGRSFQSLEQVAGAGNSQAEIHYSFIDRDILERQYSGPVYYRLKQIDYDGAYAYTDVISLEILPFSPLSIHLADTRTGSLRVHFSQRVQGALTLRLLSLQGDLIASYQGQWASGQHEWILPIVPKVSGVYLIQLQSGTQTVTQRLIHY